MAVVTTAVYRTAKARNTKWITRPRLKQALVFLILQKPQKEERNGLKVYPDFGKEEGRQIQCKYCTHM